MAYTGYYRTFPGITAPFGSRATATIYPGAVCPMKANFGFTHGTAPARGTVSFAANVIAPLGQEIMIQVGQSVFLGLLVRAQKDFSNDRGFMTTYHLVDWRDRLHDIHHFAQYNMGDEKGRRWHILPKFWSTQQRTFITTAQDVTDILEEQRLEDLLEGFNVNNYDQCPPLFSAYSLLAYLAISYNFTFTYTWSAFNALSTIYPFDLDWNSGKRVIDCVDQILSQCNLQFTAWGNLNFHITKRGFAETPFEQAIQAGAINLCNLQGHVDSSLGAEINDKGRRVTVVGGPNKYEYWYPCLPDWNPRWTWELCNNLETGLMSTLLTKYDLTRLDKVSKLPYAFQDRRNFNGKKRNDMTIEDYASNIPYRVYRVDFGWPLEQPFPWEANGDRSGAEQDLENPVAFDPAHMFLVWNYRDFVNEVGGGQVGYFTSDDAPLRIKMLWHEYSFIGNFLYNFKPWNQGGSFLHRSFDPKSWLDYQTADTDEGWQQIRSWHYIDSPYPLSQHLITDDNRQFVAMATTRATFVKGQTTLEQFAKGQFTFVSDGVSLDVEEYVVPQSYQTNMRNATLQNERGNIDGIFAHEFGDQPPAGQINFLGESYPDEFACRERYCVRLIFSEMRYRATTDQVEIPANEETGAPAQTVPTFEAKPDWPFVKLCQDREIYHYIMGEDYGGVRLRETIVSAPDLYYPIVEFKQKAIIRNPESFSYVPPERQINVSSNLTVDEVAQQVAYRALNHEFITNAGYVKFRNVAGFVPSGMIDNVSVDFSSSGGTQESVNFTNLRNDERVTKITKIQTKAVIATETEIKHDALIRGIRDAMKDIQNGVAGGKAGKQARAAADNNQQNIEAGFGKDGVANVKFNTDDMEDTEVLAPGHLVIVKASDADVVQ